MWEVPTIATLAITVAVQQKQKGAHMSRFMRHLAKRHVNFRPDMARELLNDLVVDQESTAGYLKMDFPLPLEREAPLSLLKGCQVYDCHFEAHLDMTGGYDSVVGVRVPVTSLCPCSKEISKHGAHNQRSWVTIRVRVGETAVTRIWFEDLIDMAERNASCQVYPILKRVDEKAVTERAYENPKFAEDIVRDVALELGELCAEGQEYDLLYYLVQSEHEESIHAHNCVAQAEAGERGPRLGLY